MNLVSFVIFRDPGAKMEEKASGFGCCGGWSLPQKRAASNA
jgi:hypothetical protein